MPTQLLEEYGFGCYVLTLCSLRDDVINRSPRASASTAESPYNLRAWDESMRWPKRQ